MKACVNTFRHGIEELLAFLISAEHESELTKLLFQRQSVLDDHEKQLLSQIVTARTNRRRYIYAVAIVSLYGLFERFIDSLVEAFVHRIANSVASYDGLPGAIRKNHFNLSLGLAKAIEDNRHWTRITQEDVIANLHSCLSGATDFHVNGAAFVVHTGNLTLKKITEILKTVGVYPHYRRVTFTSELANFFKVIEPERDIKIAGDQELQSLLDSIDELVERRNQVSHGVIDDIESTDLLKERCHFLNAYGGGLYEVMLQEALMCQINHSSVQKLGKPINIFNDSIICFETDNCQIAVGNILAAATGDSREPIRYGPVASLEIDGKSYPNIVSSQVTKFGAKVSFRGAVEYDYYVLPAETI